MTATTTLSERIAAAPERLACVAIIRDGVTRHEGDWREHWRLRAALGDEEPHERRHGDEEGYWTDRGRFVDRTEAWQIASAAGQTATRGGRLLSSDVDWDGQPPKTEKPYGGYKSPYRQTRRMFRP